MKNKKVLSLLSACIITAMSFLSGCAEFYDNSSILKIYEADALSQKSAYSLVVSTKDHELTGFADKLVVVPEEYNDTNESFSCSSAALFCLDDNQTLFAYNVHEILNPASITKLMTAYLTVKYGNLNDIVTITDASTITEIGAMLIGLKPGDKISLRDLLGYALINSGNDAASAIAVHISGSVDAFAELMTSEAHKLGATNTTFKNPHGLTQEGHLTTVYDTYLILKECFKYDTILEFMQMPTYTATYTLADGSEKTRTVKHTMRYHTGEAVLNNGLTLLGGKTGTTNAAGHCLSLIVENQADNKHYIAIIFKAYTRDDLYTEMQQLLELCVNDK